MLTKEEKEIHFGEFIQCVAFELNNPKEADLEIEEKEKEVFLSIHFYEKKFFKKNYKDTLIITVDQEGSVQFRGKGNNINRFKRERILGFLKYQLAYALDSYFHHKTNYGGKVLKRHYQ